MPKLIEIGPGQAVGLTRESAATQGGQEAAALGRVGSGISSVGRALQSYQDTAAQAAARDYQMGLRALRQELRTVGDPDKRESLFEERRSTLRDKVGRANPFANQGRYNREADIYEADAEMALREETFATRLAIRDDQQVRIVNGAAIEAADATSVGDASRVVINQAEMMGILVKNGEMSPQRRTALMNDLVVGAITERAETDPDGAQALFEQFGDRVSPQQHAALEKSLQAEVTASHGRDVFDSARDELGDDATLSDYLAFSKANAPDGDARDDADKRLRTWWTGRNQEIADQRFESAESLFREVRAEFAEGRPSAEDLTAMRDSLRKRAARAQIGEGSTGNLFKLFDQLSGLDADVTTDWSVYNRAMSELGQVGEPGALSVEALSLALAPKQFEKVMERSRKFKEEGEFPNHSMIMRELKRGFELYQIDDDGEQGVRVEQVLDRLSRGGKVPEPDDVRQALDSIIAAEVSTRGSRVAPSLFGSDPRQFRRDSASAVIDSVGQETPRLVYLAHAAASKSGAFEPTEEEVASELGSIMDGLERVRRTRGDRAYFAKVKELEKMGRAELISLADRNYEGLNEIGAGADEEVARHRREKARKEEEALQEKVRSAMESDVAALEKWERENLGKPPSERTEPPVSDRRRAELVRLQVELEGTEIPLPRENTPLNRLTGGIL